MEYIKVSRVIVRVRNSLGARCPWQAEIILAASLRGRCPQKILQGCKRHGQVEDVNFIPWFIVFTTPCAISERFIIYCWHVALWRGGTGGTLVCALRPRAALVLLFWPCTGGHCGWGGRGGASLFLKVCDNDGDVAHSYCQLLCGAPVHVFQPGPESNTTGEEPMKSATDAKDFWPNITPPHTQTAWRCGNESKTPARIPALTTISAD